MEKFTLFHVAIYSKGWYKPSNKGVWEDLKILLSLDGYLGEVLTKEDITSIVLNNCQRLDVRAFRDLCMFSDAINPKNTWKHGYVSKGNTPFNINDVKLPEFDYYENIIRYCLSHLRLTETAILTNKGKLPMPDFIRGLPRENGVTNEKLKQMFK